MNIYFIKKNYLTNLLLRKFFSIIILSVIITGCASKTYDINTKENAIPSWYMEDKSSSDKIYSKGTATSQSLELAVLKALNLALSDMAVKAQGSLDTTSIQSNSEKLNKDDRNKKFNSDDQINKEVKIEVKDFIIPNYKVVKKEAFIDKHKNYRVYMMLEFNKLRN